MNESKDNAVRLNKFIADSGYCSRRKAEEYIFAGKVSVNNEIITSPALKVISTDIISINNKTLSFSEKVYILLNKPKDIITTTNDEKNRKTVLDIIEIPAHLRVFPIGRLDRNTTGVILLTNDGDLANALTHPSKEIRKIYYALLDNSLSLQDANLLTEGIQLDDETCFFDSISYHDSTKKKVYVELHSGKYHIVKRMFSELGYKVKQLDRVSFAGINKDNLRRGSWRYLNNYEISFLKKLC